MAISVVAAVGGNPQDALKAGTFAPGDLGDTTAKGNTCDNANDPEGCIFTQNLLVEVSFRIHYARLTRKLNCK